MVIDGMAIGSQATEITELKNTSREMLYLTGNGICKTPNPIYCFWLYWGATLAFGFR